MARTMEEWQACSAARLPEAWRFSREQQRQRERAYDAARDEVEREAKRARRGAVRGSVGGWRSGFQRGAGGGERQGKLKKDPAETRGEIQKRITAAFARFAATALDLPDEAITLLTEDFLPVGTGLARWARQFDPGLSMAEIIQAARNAWTACGLQPLLGQPMRLTPSILGYSLLYPYSDNFLDGETSDAAKLRFSERFRERLRGDTVAARDDREAPVWALVDLVEQEYPRARFPQVYDSLLAIHRAQEWSLRQVRGSTDCPLEDLLRVSCAKGGTSVLADACLAQPWLTEAENRFAFAWGVLLQLGDDLQDVREDSERRSMTLFSRAAARGERLDGLVIQLLTFAERVGAMMEALPQSTPTLNGLLRMSWRSLILMAVAEAHEHCSAEFLRAAEEQSPFRFGFLRERREKLAGRRGLYATLFELFLTTEDRAGVGLPVADAALAVQADVA
ncbi:MAG TPA: hypothetical protein VHX37_02190 [Acidobacteriaceae bacterium]|nr:hypothetical protein [Acidobacteriaceae bacterium]